MPRRKKTIKTNEIPKRITLQVVPKKTENTKRAYSNYVQVTHTPHDFTLSFCEVSAIRDDEKEEIAKSKKAYAPIHAEMVLPVSLIEPLIKAIQSNYEIFKKTKSEN